MYFLKPHLMRDIISHLLSGSEYQGLAGTVGKHLIQQLLKTVILLILLDNIYYL